MTIELETLKHMFRNDVTTNEEVWTVMEDSGVPKTSEGKIYEYSLGEYIKFTNGLFISVINDLCEEMHDLVSEKGMRRYKTDGLIETLTSIDDALEKYNGHNS